MPRTELNPEQRYPTMLVYGCQPDSGPGLNMTIEEARRYRLCKGIYQNVCWAFKAFLVEFYSVRRNEPKLEFCV